MAERRTHRLAAGRAEGYRPARPGWLRVARAGRRQDRAGLVAVAELVPAPIRPRATGFGESGSLGPAPCLWLDPADRSRPRSAPRASLGTQPRARRASLVGRTGGAHHRLASAAFLSNRLADRPPRPHRPPSSGTRVTSSNQAIAPESASSGNPRST